MVKTVLFTNTMLPSQEIDRLKGMGYNVRIERNTIYKDEDALIDALDGVSAHIVAGSEIYTPRVINAAESLEVIAFFGGDPFKNVPPDAMDTATKRGIPVTYTPGGNAQAVAEFSIGLALDLVRKIDYFAQRTKQGGLYGERTWNLKGKTLGIVGMGHVGQRLTHIAKAGFEMRVIYYSRNRKQAVEESLGAIWQPSLHELLGQSDIVSLHVKLSEETTHMIGAKELDVMPSKSILIDSSRPQLINPVDLKNALVQNKIAAAGMDGYYQEPVTVETDPYGLLSLPPDRFLATSHIAWLTDDSVIRMVNTAIESVLAVIHRKEEPAIIANPDYKSNRKLKEVLIARSAITSVLPEKPIVDPLSTPEKSVANHAESESATDVKHSGDKPIASVSEVKSSEQQLGDESSDLKPSITSASQTTSKDDIDSRNVKSPSAQTSTSTITEEISTKASPSEKPIPENELIDEATLATTLPTDAVTKVDPSKKSDHKHESTLNSESEDNPSSVNNEP